MDILKNYIEENKALFEQDELPEGHEERFVERQKIRRKRRVILLIYSSSVALILLILSIGTYLLQPCPTGDGACYYAQIVKLSGQIEQSTNHLPEFKQREILMSMYSIMPQSEDELLNMLPAGMNEKDVKHLNKEYYKRLYEGMKEIASLTKYPNDL